MKFTVSWFYHTWVLSHILAVSVEVNETHMAENRGTCEKCIPAAIINARAARLKKSRRARG
jgi:hypothetical protein